MKHRLLFTLLLGGMALGASAQDYTIVEDLTSKLTNADFSMDTPVETIIRTYDYDMPDNGAGSGEDGAKGLFGMQPVVGWTASHPTDNTKVSTGSDDANARKDGLNAKAAGVFAYDDESGEELPGLGGAAYTPPFLESTLTGNALGIVAVWGSDISYTQSVDLPSGAYMLVMTVYNQAGTGELKNNFGYIVNDETKYMSTAKTYAVGMWETDTVVFRLTDATSGKVSLGFSFGSGSGSAPHLFIDNVKLYKIDENELIQEEINKKKEELYAQIELGRGYGVDVSEALAVYNNPNATMAEVEAAIAKQKELNESGVTDLSEAFITNPHFSQDDAVVGGICTYDYDCSKNNIDLANYSELPVTGWTPVYTSNGRASGVYAVGSDAFLGGTGYLPPTTLSNGDTEGKVLGFVTCWGITVQYTQQATLPAGKYTLTLSYYNVGGTRAISKNLIGFIDDDGNEYLGKKTTFTVGSWTTEDIEFELTEQTSGYFTLGYTSSGGGSGENPHFFTDGISLVYVGTDVDPTFLALQAAVASGSKLLDEDFNADLKSALEAAVEEGRDLIRSSSSDEEANRAATSAITSKLADCKSSIEAYGRLEEFANGDLTAALDKYQETEPDLYNEIGLLNDEVMTALDEFNMTNEEIDATIAKLPEIIKTYTQTAFDNAVAAGTQLENDLDITILYDNLGVTYSTTAVQGSSVPDKQWEYGDASNFKTQYGTAEVWNQSPFTVSQTMTNMPAGVYTLKVRAYYRTSDNESNYNNYNPDNDYAYIFAGSQKTPLTNVNEIASSNADEFLNSAAVADGTLYVPNNQQTANAIFGDSNYDSKLLKSVQTVLVEDGDLTFGITADQMESNSWVVWSSFELYYNALDGQDQLINDELEALLAVANDYVTEGCSGVIDVLESMGDAYEKGETAFRGTVEDRITAIKNLKSSISEADKAAELVEELNTVRGYFETLQSEAEYTSEDQTFSQLIDNASTGMYESNSSIEEMIDAFPSTWASYVLGQDMSKASEESPVDISGIILNNDFEIENSNYWTIDDEIGKNQGYQGAEYTNAEGDITVSKFIEVWREKPGLLNDGEVSQTLASTLPEGYYTIEVDGFAVNQNGLPADGSDISGAGLMVKVGETLNYQDMGVNADGASPTHWTLSFYSDGVSPVTVGLHVEGTNANWLAADNFTLKFIGSEAPTGIEEVKESIESIDLNNAVIYNVSGQRLQNVQRGINIINGKKVLIK